MGKLNHTSEMLNFTEVCVIVGITPSHPSAKTLKNKLTKYINPFSATRCFKMSDVKNMIENFQEQEKK